jgi:hypothetical protein
MTLKAELRAIQAAEQRQQREAKKRQRELERQAKELAKLSALEEARLEVERYENTLDVLLSIHKEQADASDWPAFAASLPPVPPRRHSYNEFRVHQSFSVSVSQQNAPTALQDARQRDEREYQDALKNHDAEHAEWRRLSALARRVLDGDKKAYIEAIREFNPFAELSSIGSALHFTVHNARIIECVLSTKGREAIPSEVKSLTASGKVSIKPMPRPRFVEIYQDYVCGCVLRVARELFALLPLDAILITALAESLDSSTGQTVERPFLSVIIRREALGNLNFDRLDPSDTIMSLTHQGTLKTSRKSGDFEFITPLNAADLTHTEIGGKDLNAVLEEAHRLRAELAADRAAIGPQSERTLSANGEM